MPGENGGLADPAGDRRLDLGVGEVDLRVAQRRLGLLERGLGLELLALALVVGRLRAGVGAQQIGGALELDLGVGERGLGGVARGRLLVDRRLVGVGLDREQDLAFLDLVAVVELARTEEALHARPQVDLVDRGRTADELRPRGQRLELGSLHQHGRRRPGLLRLRCAETRRADQRRDCQKPCDAHLCPPASRRMARLPHALGTVTD